MTENELKMLVTFYQLSVDCCGRCDDDENMSWANARDLQGEMGDSLQSIGGTMSSLSDKGYIVDSGESARGCNINDFYINTSSEVFNKVVEAYQQTYGEGS